jgi:hypothetical protein
LSGKVVEIGPGVEDSGFGFDGLKPTSVFDGMRLEAVDGQPVYRSGEAVDFAVDAEALTRLVKETGILREDERVGCHENSSTHKIRPALLEEIVVLAAALEGAVDKEQAVLWGEGCACGVAAHGMNSR